MCHRVESICVATPAIVPARGRALARLFAGTAVGPVVEAGTQLTYARRVTIRELDRARDRAGVEAVDTAFETASVFDVAIGPRTIELVERPLAQPLTKRYS